MADIVTLGELLIDLTQTDVTAEGVRLLAAFPGGAPANVAVAAARLGVGSAFIGKVGRDSFGADLRRVLSDNGVDVTGLYDTAEAATTLAIVTVRDGERSFSFYRSPGADTRLTREEVLRALGQGAGALPWRRAVRGRPLVGRIRRGQHPELSPRSGRRRRDLGLRLAAGHAGHPEGPRAAVPPRRLPSPASGRSAPGYCRDRASPPGTA